MSELSTLIELNDSDLLRIEKAVIAINDKQRRVVNLEAFRKEIVERFGLEGFKVNVKTYTTSQDGLYAFDIEIVERLEGQFDPDKMVYEATNDVLDLGEGGVINSKGLITPSGVKHNHKH